MLYSELATIYDDLHESRKYDAQSVAVVETIRQLTPNASTFLEVACGTGLFLEHLKSYFSVEGTDVNPEMLKVAEGRLPGVPLHLSDMRTLKLDRCFDVVACLFSSIAYMKNRDDLCRAIENMAQHVSPGGILCVEPFFSKDTFWTDRITMDIVDKQDIKITRMYVAKKTGDIGRLDIHYLVGEKHGVRHFVERHDLGLFEDRDYAIAFEKIGYHFSRNSTGISGRGLYVSSSYDFWHQ